MKELFAIIKNQPIKLQMVGFFALKYGTPYGGIRDSEQLRRDTIWGYPEQGASNCVRHIVSPGLDGLKATFTTGFVHRSVITK